MIGERNFPLESLIVTHYAALWSMVYMMSFVFLFDGVHKRGKLRRLLASVNLMSNDELGRIRATWSACQDEG